jgi:hypothetical protein
MSQTEQQLMVRWSYARVVTAEVTHHQFPSSIIGPADDADVYVHSRSGALHLSHCAVSEIAAYRGRTRYRVAGVNDDGEREVWYLSRETCSCSRQISATVAEDVPA